MAADVLGSTFRQQDPRGDLGPGPVARAQPVYDWGKPLAEVGKSLEQLGSVHLVEQHRAAVLYANTEAANARLSAQTAFEKAKDAGPEDGKGFAEGFGKSLDADFQARLAAAPDALSKAKLNLELTRMKGEFAPQAQRFEDATGKDYQKSRLDTSLDAARASVYADPEHLEGALGNVVTAVHAAPLDDKDKRAYSLAAQNELTQAAWLRRSIDQPETTLMQLKAGPPEGMASKDYINLSASTQERVTAAQKEEERQAKQAAAEAKAAAAQRMYENQAALGQRVQGEIAMRADGVSVKNPITRSDVAAAYPAHQVDKAWTTFQDHARTGDAIGLVKGMSFPDQDALLSKLRPSSTDSATYGDQAADLAAASKAVAGERERFHTDQAGYVAANVPAVRQAFNEARQDPSKLGAAVALSIKAQQSINPAGEPVPLPKEAASDAVTSWKAAPDTAGKLAALVPFTLGLGDDKLARKSLDQLEAAGLPAGADRALEAARSGDENRAREIMATLSVKEGDLPKMGDATGQQLSTALTALYQQPNLASAEAHGASVTGQPGNVQMAARGQKLLQQLAQRYAANGEGAADAVQHAYHTAYGDGAAAGNADLGIVRVPPGVDKDQLQTGLAVARANVDVSHLAPTKEAVKAMLSQGGKSPSDGEVNGTLAQVTGDHALWTDDVRQYSRWAPAPGGYQLVIPSGQAVTGADGKPRVWSADEIIHHALGGGRADIGSTSVPSFEGEPATQGVAVAQGKRPGDVPVRNPFGDRAAKLGDLTVNIDKPDNSDLAGSR